MSLAEWHTVKVKCIVLHFGARNQMLKCTTRTNLLASSSAEEDLGGSKELQVDCESIGFCLFLKKNEVNAVLGKING